MKTPSIPSIAAVSATYSACTISVMNSGRRVR